MKSKNLQNAAGVISAKRTNKIDTRTMVLTAMLSAMAFVLMYLQISVPVMPSFIKLDLSDLPALIAACCAGPVSGVFVCLVKNLIHLFFTNTAGVGELANFLMGALFVVPAGLVCKRSRTRKAVFIGALLGAMLMAAGSVAINYFIVYPVYYNFMPKEAIIGAYKAIISSVDSILDCLIVFNLPFTFVKGMISAFLILPFYRVLLGVFEKKS